MGCDFQMTLLQPHSPAEQPPGENQASAPRPPTINSAPRAQGALPSYSQ